MSAYPGAQPALSNPIPLRRLLASEGACATVTFDRQQDATQLGASLVDALIDEVARRVVSAITAQLSGSEANGDDDWLDTKRAAEYLGVHRDTLRKLAAERAVPAEQDGPGCKLFFRRGDLDEWRRAGGRSVHLSSAVADAA